MSSSYQYQPLSSPSTQIRLLELLPGRGIIQCRLKVTELEEAQDTYEPISYCWKAYNRESWFGSTYKEKKKQKTFRVRVDGANFSITESLHGALRQMRFESRARLLWADAICINQDDDKEKSAQVAMMAQIYKGGFRTLAWLGEADHRTRKALKFLKDRADRAWQPRDPSPGTEQSEQEMNSSAPQKPNFTVIYAWLPALWNNFCYRRSEVAVESTIGRPYFTRAWVVQEIANSDRVLFMCGKYIISWEDLVHGFSATNYSLTGYTSFNALKFIRRSLQDCDLMDVAKMASPTQASDPRDKLYCLLGLVPDEAMTVDITVDYDKDPGEVFYDFTKGLLLSDTKLTVLSMSYGCSPAKPRHMPSWVWNPQPDEPHDRISFFDRHTNHYQAARNSESQPQICGKILGLRGILLQTVTTVTSGFERIRRPNLPLFHVDDPRDDLQKILSYLEKMDVGGINEVSADSTTAERRRYILFRTVWPYNFSNKTPLPAFDELQETQTVMDLNHFDSMIVERYGRYVPGDLKHITHWSRFRLLVAVEMWFIRNTLGDPAAQEFFELWYFYLQHQAERRLAKTDTGHLALCPKETSVNDKLVLLQGSGVPFILRPIGDHWQIVGECYVHELMDGSAWDESRCEMLLIE